MASKRKITKNDSLVVEALKQLAQNLELKAKSNKQIDKRGVCKVENRKIRTEHAEIVVLEKTLTAGIDVNQTVLLTKDIVVKVC